MGRIRQSGSSESLPEKYFSEQSTDKHFELTTRSVHIGETDRTATIAARVMFLLLTAQTRRLENTGERKISGS